MLLSNYFTYRLNVLHFFTQYELHLLENVDMCSSNANILLTGDVNGHTGELNDFVETDKLSKDSKVNQVGRRLVNM